MNSMRGELEKALSNVGRNFEEDQLAFLTLTSKPELQIRDALAWRLHRAFPDLIVSREWRRTDLAVLDRAGNPPWNPYAGAPAFPAPPRWRGILSVCHVTSSIDGRVHASFATPVALKRMGYSRNDRELCAHCWPPSMSLI